MISKVGTAACGGKGLKGRAAVSGERPIGAASCRQQHSNRPLPLFQYIPREEQKASAQRRTVNSTKGSCDSALV